MNPTPPPAPEAALTIFLAVLALQRAVELSISARHTRTLVAYGAREFGRRHFPMFVALHLLFPASLAYEVLVLRARPGHLWPAWLAVWLTAQALRVWAIRSLGTFWNVRVWVLPGKRPIRRGPYGRIPHPNYVAVALEFLSAPLMFGAWRTMVLFVALNAVAMAIRVPVEERALRWAAEYDGLEESSSAAS